MFYLGCLPLLAIILLLVVISFVRGLLRTAVDVLYGLYLTVRERWFGLFRPTPTESEIDDINYYRPTEERPKFYTSEDGKYISYKETKK